MRVFGLALALLPFLPATASAQLMNTGGGRPSVSRDGRWITYSAARDGRWDVYVIHPDGSGGRQVTNIAEPNFVNLGPPTWVGEQVLVFRRITDTTRLALVNPSSPPTEMPLLLSSAARWLLDALQLRPSPDGKRLVFLHGDRRRPRVAVANMDGTGFHDLTDSTVIGINPDWSPDSKQIAFTVVDSASHGQIAVVDADGTNYRVITRFDPGNGLPQWASWAPDGKRLAIQAGVYNRQKIEESNAHLWLIDVATGQTTKLAPHAGMSLDETPSWFPDGKRIAFQSNRSGVMQVWTMNADGTDPRQVTGRSPDPSRHRPFRLVLIGERIELLAGPRVEKDVASGEVQTAVVHSDLAAAVDEPRVTDELPVGGILTPAPVAVPADAIRHRLDSIAVAQLGRREPQDRALVVGQSNVGITTHGRNPHDVPGGRDSRDAVIDVLLRAREALGRCRPGGQEQGQHRAPHHRGDVTTKANSCSTMTI